MVVMDISSDDDADWGGGVTAYGDDGGLVGCWDDGDWLLELLGEVDKEKDDDDSDDVVVVDEVIVKPKLRVSKTLAKCVNKVRDEKDVDDDDDECMVLDGDPDKPVSIQKDKDKDKGGGGGEEDSDDLLVLSEKGPVACRDYPHARHLCVKFPFNSTTHESHCDQCHCYVCDSLAPCVHWSSGSTAVDHCHANDKDEFWKNQRSAKKSNGTLPVASRAPEISTFVGQTPPSPISSSLPSECMQRYVTPQSTTSRMTQQFEYSSRDKLQHRLVSRQLQFACRNVSRSDKTHIGVNAGSRVISQTPFRRSTLTPGAITANQYCNNTYRYTYTRRNPPGMLGPRWVDHRSRVTRVLNAYKDSSRANAGGIAANIVPNTPAQTNVGSVNYSPVHPQMLPPAHGGSGNIIAEGLQHQVSSQMNVSSNFISPMVAQSAIGTEPMWGHTFDNSSLQSQETSSLERAKVSQNSGPFLPSTTFPSNMADFCNYSFTSQPNAGNAFENSSACQSLFSSLATSPFNSGEHVFVEGIHSQSDMQSSSTDVQQDASGENLIAQSNTIQSVMHPNSKEVDHGLDLQRNCKNQLLAVNRLPIAVQSNEPYVPSNGNSELPVCPDFYPLDLQFDPWIFENESGLDAVENPLFCPEATVLEGGIFDF